MTAYYNEIDPYAAAWLRNLIAAGHIAPGDVDERSIRDVKAEDLVGYTQCHFFAGIGVWSYALRQAGWPDDRPVWTGSCPCQPFSAAGKRGGTSDDRHLWPAFGGLIAQCRPRVVFGEQVASKAGLAWLDIVHADLEAAGYAVGALDLCAAGVGAPHIRQRLFFVGDSAHEPRQRDAGAFSGTQTRVNGARFAVDGRVPVGSGNASSGVGAAACELEVANEGERGPWRIATCAEGGAQPQPPRSSPARELAYADGGDASAEGLQRGGKHGQQPQDGGATRNELADAGSKGRRQVGAQPERRGSGSGTARLEQRPEHGGPVNGYWRDADWLPCIDGKARPVEPGTFPLAHGIAGRVGRLRAYGNAIVAPVAAEFIGAYMSIRADSHCEHSKEQG